ncbi:MAG: sensor histidine kinase, partial [Ornithinimicrobium sp.]
TGSMNDKASPKDPWERWGWLMSTIWLVFLLFPFFAALNAPVAWGWRIATIGGLVVFAVVYTEAFVKLSHSNSARRHRDLGLSRFSVLVALSVAMAPVLEWNALGLTPFLVSFGSFFFTTRTTISIIGTSLALAGLGIWLGGPEVWVFPGIILLVGVSTQLVSHLDRRQHEQRELGTQITLATERDRVARDVHDVLGHSLTVISVKAELAQRLMELDPDRAKDELAQIQTLSRQALAEVRTTVGGLRSARLEDELLTAQTMLADAGIACVITGDSTTVDPRHRTVCAWVLREAVTNVVRHSRATECTVELTSSGVTVTDNGRGLTRSPLNGQTGNGHRAGNGIRGLTERVEAVGGKLDVVGGTPGQGTALKVSL